MRRPRQPGASAPGRGFDVPARSRDRYVQLFLAGLHASPFHGFSVEFSEHRKYTAGDNISDVDWAATIGRNLDHYVPEYRTVIPERLVGHQRHARGFAADVIVAIASIDPVMGGVDR